MGGERRRATLAALSAVGLLLCPGGLLLRVHGLLLLGPHRLLLRVHRLLLLGVHRLLRRERHPLQVLTLAL